MSAGTFPEAGKLALALILSAGIVSGAYASDDNLKRIENDIEAAKIFQEGAKVRLLRCPRAIAVSTYKHPIANERDMRIDALLIAHEIVRNGETASSAIIYFFRPDDQNNYFQVSVDLEIVRQFEEGSISTVDLFQALTAKHGSLPSSLQSLSEKSYEEITTSIRPIDGLMLKERQNLAKEIDLLRRLGKRIPSLETAFLILEDAVRQNDDLGAMGAYAYARELLDNTRLKADAAESAVR